MYVIVGAVIHIEHTILIANGCDASHGITGITICGNTKVNTLRHKKGGERYQ
jgi:hypothetical protein